MVARVVGGCGGCPRGAGGSGGREGREAEAAVPDGGAGSGSGRTRLAVACGSRMRRGRSGLDALGGRTSGAGLLLSRRFGPRELGEWSRLLSCEPCREWRPFGLGAAVRAAHLRRRALTALTMRSLSPTLEMLISLRRVSWSSSRRMSPRMSCSLKASAWTLHRMSASQRATCASDHDLRKSAKGVSAGGSRTDMGELLSGGAHARRTQGWSRPLTCSASLLVLNPPSSLGGPP